MQMPRWLQAAAGSPTRFKLRRQAARFLATTVDCRRTQQDVLQRLLALNSDSQFSRDHRLSSAHTPGEFRKRLPITDYEYFRPYIDQLKSGNHSALLGSKSNLLMFTLSSGTTADSKFIPITKQFLDDYRRGWQIWGIWAFDDHPSMNAKNIVQLSSDHNKFQTDAGSPCGNISGLAAATQRRFVRFMYTVPYIVAKIDDPDAKYYTSLRLAVADANVGLITTANPSTLIHLAQMADSEKESLIRDIADGTLSDRFAVAAEIRRQLASRVSKRNTARARQLEELVDRTGRLSPRDYWPELDIAAVWTSGSCGAYISSLRSHYGDIVVRDHGLSASEGRMTIPMADEGSEGILDLVTHFFEFVPESEYGSEKPTVLEAYELKEDENYYILLTTSYGFYRYDICDVVRCVGFHNTTPLLKFLHKGAHISNITGEKLSESQIVDAIRTCTDAIDIKFEHFTVIPSWGEPPRYQLMVEQIDLPALRIAEELTKNIDDRLQELNCEYREKRLSGRLAQVETVPLVQDTWKRFAKQRQSKLGGSIEQYKHPCLIPDMKYCTQFKNDFAADREQQFEPAASVQKVAE